LIAGFLLVASISAVVGAVGVWYAGQINDLAGNMYERELLGLSYVKEANIELIGIGRERSNFLLSTTQAEREKHLAAIQKSSNLVKENLAKSRPLFVTDRAKELFANFDRVWDDYQREMQKVLAVAAIKKLHERDETLAQGMQAVREKADNLDNMLDELTKQKEARASQANDEADALYARSRHLLMAIIAAGVVIGIVLGWLISRSVSRPIAKAVEAAHRLAEGDMTVAIRSTSRDEIGQLLDAMHNMTTRLSQVVSEVNASAEALAGASEEVDTLPKPGAFDLVFLRNVMIYFNGDTKRHVVARVLSTLRPGGHLCIGHSENLNGITTEVRPVAPSIYRKPPT